MSLRGTQATKGWSVYLFLGALAVACSQVIPHIHVLKAWPYYTAAYLGINLSSVAALAFGIRRYRPRTVAWQLILANQVVYLVADFLFYVGRDKWGWTSFPAPADAFYLAHYPFLVAGIAVLIRARRSGSGFENTADSVIAGVGFGVLSWILLIAPNAQAGGPMLSKLTSVAYPVADLVTFLIAIRLLVGGGSRNPSFRLLIGSLTLLFATDSVYAWLQINGNYTGQKWLDVMWLCYYIALGASALHPSMAAVAHTPANRRPTRARYVALGLLSVVTPAIGIIDSYFPIKHAGVSIDWAALVLFVAVAVRMVVLIGRQQGLLAANRRQAAQVSDALEVAKEAQADRARLLSETVNAGERERVRIAAELHDGPIQHLASTAYSIDSVLLRLARGQMQGTVDALARIRDGLADDVGTLRTMMSELRPPVLDEGGLVPALTDYLAAYSRRTGIDAELTSTLAGTEMPAERETVLYRVVQEALANVERHARAIRVDVGLHLVDDGAVELTVCDDGVGFDSSNATKFVKQGHFGLAGMRERIEGAHGWWKLVSMPDHGTLITAAVPLSIDAPVLVSPEPSGLPV